jgi:hypothetical protein
MPLYHGTSTSRLSEISEHGLVPQHSHDNGDRVCVYLANRLSLAELYADLAAQRRGGEPVILVVDETHLDVRHCFPDDYDLQDCIDDLHDPDRDSDIGVISGIAVDERLRPYRSWWDVPARLSLEVTGQVAYDAVIPPTAVRILNAQQALGFAGYAHSTNPGA